MVAAPPMIYAPSMSPEGRAYNEKPTIPGTFGHFIRTERKALGWTAKDFAQRVGDGMDESDVSRLEHGKVNIPEMPRLVRIAQAFGTPWPVMVAAHPELGALLPPDLLSQGVAEAHAAYDVAWAKKVIVAGSELTPDERERAIQFIRRIPESRRPEDRKRQNPAQKRADDQ